MLKEILKRGPHLLPMPAALTALVMACLLLTGCSAAGEKADKIRDLEFTVIGGAEQPDTLKEIIEEKGGAPFQISYALGDDLYIAIGYGEQESGGYSISVNSFYEGEKALYIDTTLLGPGSADHVTSTPTTPYIVIKTENIADKPIEFN